MYQAILFLPLIGAIFAGLLRPLRGRARLRGGDHLADVHRRLPVVDRLLSGRHRGQRRPHRADRLDPLRRVQDLLVHPRRHADRGDARRGQHGVLRGAPLFRRLHGRGPAQGALLRLSVDVHLRHAGAGDLRRSVAAVLRLGRRRPRLLSPDRLLVPEARSQRRRHQGLHRQPRRRFRLRARHLRHLRRVRRRAIRHDLRRRPRSGRPRP